MIYQSSIYKSIMQHQKKSSTSEPNKWLPTRKTVPPVPVFELVFKVQKLDKCNSKILPRKLTQKSVKTASGLREPTEDKQKDFLNLTSHFYLCHKPNYFQKL